MSSTRKLHELAADKVVEKANAAGLQSVHQVWRHAVVGVAAPLDIHLKDEGASIVGNDFQPRSGIRFGLPVPPPAEQRESPEWNSADRAATMTASQIFELFNFADYRDELGQPLTHNLDFITLVMLATKP